MNKKILVWCHGGCFNGGSIEYDKELRNYLSKNNICEVICVDFNLLDWTLALDDIINKVAELQNNFNNNIILGGISSGALLAHEVANRLTLPAVLICPVIKPASRHKTLPEDLKTKQLNFFHLLEYMEQIENSIQAPNNARYILYGKNDTRAPLSAFNGWLSFDNIFYDELDQGHEICINPPCDLIGKKVALLIKYHWPYENVIY